jgi:hypothetical protein
VDTPITKEEVQQIYDMARDLNKRISRSDE